jgi:hypothetical protein
VKALKDCRAGSCDVQLPTSAIQAFHDGVNWSRPDAAEQANALARPMVLQLLLAYQKAATRRSANIGTNSIPRVSPSSSRR